MARKLRKVKPLVIGVYIFTFLPQILLAFENDGTWEEGFFYSPTPGGLGSAPTKSLSCQRLGEHYGATYVYRVQAKYYPASGWVDGCCFVNSDHCPAISIIKIKCTEWRAINEPYTGCGQTPSPLVNPKFLGQADCSIRDTHGNPISISTGNKFQQEAILSTPLPLALSYNSLGQQWRHSFAYALETSDSTATLIRPDGKGLGFTKANGVWSADDGDVFYTLSAFDNGSGSTWKVTTQSGSEELYDAEGKILSITSLQGQSLNFTHTGTTTEVGDEFDNALLLTLDANEYLSAVSLNGVTQTTLTYGTEGRLISRIDAQNNTVQYHYEDTNFPNHLTGITGADGQRFATWAYDAEGRGILSEHAGQETAQFAFNADGSTTVTNSLGKQTTYHYEEIEGLKRPVQIEGHASDNCVAANQAYTYNADGLVETQTDWSGNITRFEYNDRGLVTRKTVAEGTAQERVTEQVWHETLPLLLQTQSAGRITEYQYDTKNRLMNTEELSVPSP